MTIGCLGDIVFSVSSKKIETIEKFKRSSSATYHSHAVHLHKPHLEYTGDESDTVSFEVRLSAYMGVNPRSEMAKIALYKSAGSVLPLVIGATAYGRYVIKSYSESIESYDQLGNATIIKVSISLTEYAR